MRKFFLSLSVMMLALWAFSSVARAQGAGAGAGAGPAAGGRQARPSPTANLPFDPHDFNGVWSGVAVGDLLTKEEPPMQPWAMKKYQSERTEFNNPPVDGPENTDPLFKCEPGSVPRDYFVNHPIEFVQTPKEIVMLMEVYRNFRIIYMDGRKQPDHPEGTWYGDSVGHWEGNTLVVDTVNFNDRSWLDKVGHPHTDKLHLTERFTRVDHDHLRDEITIDDPGAYTKPWGGVKNFVYKPDWILEDYLCSPADESFMSKVVRDPADSSKLAPAAKK